MATRKRRETRSELPEILASILESRGATLTRRGTVMEASIPADLTRGLGVDKVRLVAAPAGRAARGAEMDAAITERILLLGRSHGEVTRLVGRVPGKSATGEPKQWVRLHWRIRYGTDDLAEELLVQRLPVGSGGVVAPADSVLREPTAEEAKGLKPPDPELLAAAWLRGLRQLESRIRRRLRPHEDRMRRELHREMRTLSTHFRSLIAEERTGRRRREEGRGAGRILQLKEDWERKLAAAIRQRALDTEAKLVAAALIVAVPDGRGAKAV
ncbi:MAG: hypothetical protein ACRENN_10415 [Candidatus Eiseniibacteriota bacterium]